MKETTPTCVRIILLKSEIKRELDKANREKQSPYGQWNKDKDGSRFSLKTMKARRQQKEIFKVPKGKTQPIFPHPRKIPFKNEGEALASVAKCLEHWPMH